MVLVFNVLCYFYLDKTIFNFNIAPIISDWFWQKKKNYIGTKKLPFFNPCTDITFIAKTNYQ